MKTPSRIAAAALICLAVGPAHAAQYALVVGVNACPEFRVGGIVAVRPLRGAEYDARLFAETLVERWAFSHENVTTLLGAEASHAAVDAALERLSDTAGPDDTVLFYFAGHGTQAPDTPPLDEPPDERLDEALCLSDTNALGENLLRDDRLAAWIRGLKAAGVTVLLDCCHSGTGIKGSDDEPMARGITLPSVARRPAAGGATGGTGWAEFGRVAKASGTRVVALYACDAGQSAYERRFATPEGARLPMGQFTHFLLESLANPALADADGDGRLSIGEVSAYVAGRIDVDFNAHRPEPKRQTPRHDAARDAWDLLPAPGE